MNMGRYLLFLCKIASVIFVLCKFNEQSVVGTKCPCSVDTKGTGVEFIFLRFNIRKDGAECDLLAIRAGFHIG